MTPTTVDTKAGFGLTKVLEGRDKGDAGGITYSKNVATFKVTAGPVNAKGELKADVEKTSGETKFTNTYSAKTETPLTLEATKDAHGAPDGRR